MPALTNGSFGLYDAICSQMVSSKPLKLSSKKIIVLGLFIPKCNRFLLIWLILKVADKDFVKRYQSNGS